MQPNPLPVYPPPLLPCYTASIWFSSALLSNVPDVSVAFQCRVGRSDQELWQSRSLEQSALLFFPIVPFHVVLPFPTCRFPSFPAPSDPARFIRYHCHVCLLGSSPFSPILNAFCPPQWLCLSLPYCVGCYQTYEWSPGSMTTALWNVIFCMRQDKEFGFLMAGGGRKRS